MDCCESEKSNAPEPTPTPLKASVPVSVKDYYPLLLIFLFIAGFTLLSQLKSGPLHWMPLVNGFMAGFFIVFSFFKFLNLRGFHEAYAAYDIVAKRVPLYGYLYPFIELALGVSFLLGAYPLITNWACLLVMSLSGVGVLRSILKKEALPCACLGTVVNLPMSKVTLLEDLLMVALSVIMLYGLP